MFFFYVFFSRSRQKNVRLFSTRTTNFRFAAVAAVVERWYSKERTGNSYYAILSSSLRPLKCHRVTIKFIALCTSAWSWVNFIINRRVYERTCYDLTSCATCARGFAEDPPPSSHVLITRLTVQTPWRFDIWPSYGCTRVFVETRIIAEWVRVDKTVTQFRRRWSLSVCTFPTKIPL